MRPANVRIIAHTVTSAVPVDAMRTGPARIRLLQSAERGSTLSPIVADYLADGLAAGQAVLLIATQSHRDSFVDLVRSRGIDVDAAWATGRLALLDARATLMMVMDGRRPDGERLRETIGPVLVRARAANPALPVRAYGELVDVLWKDGDPDGAADLEAMWNDLADANDISLLCVYEIDGVESASESEHLGDLVRQRPVAISTEYLDQLTTEGSRLADLGGLTQRARALEYEIFQRAIERRAREVRERQDRADD